MDAVLPEVTRVSLLDRLQADPRCQTSWGEFVAVYAPAIRHWCLRWGLQPSDADDVTQAVLVKLTVKLPAFDYDPTRSFRGWLKTLTHHAWHDFVTDSARRLRGSGDSGILGQLHSLEAREDLESRVAAAFDRELLDVAIERVRGRVAAATWAAFQLTALDNLSPADAAERLNIGVSRVYLARHRVQKLLQEEVAALQAG